LDKHVTIAEEGGNRYSLFHVPSDHPADDMATQCDGSRPTCRPCGKGGFTCEYGFPAGKTRAQALLESQNCLRTKLLSHASLISTLRQVDSEASIQLLGRVRSGDYDRALSGANSAFRMTAFGDIMTSIFIKQQELFQFPIAGGFLVNHTRMASCLIISL
jgi:hypothetical protein